MKKHTILLLILIPLISLGQEIDFSKIPQIQTKATYTTEVTPDKITLSITLTEGNTRGKISVEELEKKLENVLRSNNIDIKSQLKLVTLSSNFRDFLLKKTDVFKTKNYELEISNANLAGKILRELEMQEISNVKLLKTEYTKLEELKIELKSKAVLKAKKQAEQMTKALNQTLGKAIFVSDLETDITGLLQGRVSGINVIGFNSVRREYDSTEEDIEVQFDNIKVDASVTVYFELE